MNDLSYNELLAICTALFQYKDWCKDNGTVFADTHWTEKAAFIASIEAKVCALAINAKRQSN